MYVCLGVPLELFKFFFHVIYSFNISKELTKRIVLSFFIFYSKIILFLLPPVADWKNFFRYFGTSFLFVLFDSVPLTFQSSFFRQYFWFIFSSFVIRLVCICCFGILSFRWILLCFTFAVAVSLFVLLVSFSIQFLDSVGVYLFYCRLFLLRYKSIRSVRWSPLGYVAILFRSLTFFHSWFLRDDIVVFSLLNFLRINSKFVLFSCVNSDACLGSVLICLSLFCVSLR